MQMPAGGQAVSSSRTASPATHKSLSG